MDFLVELGFFLLGIVFSIAVSWLIRRKATELMLKEKSAKGVIAKQDQAERLIMFLTEVKAGYDRAKSENRDLKEFASKDLPAIALKYPDIIMRFGSKLYKLYNSGESLGSILENGLV